MADDFELSNVAMGGMGVQEDPEGSSSAGMGFAGPGGGSSSSFASSPWPPGTSAPGASNSFHQYPSPGSSPTRQPLQPDTSSAFPPSGGMQPGTFPRQDTMQGMMGGVGSFDLGSIGSGIGDSLADEPPLLEELEINFVDIARKTKNVLQPFSTPDSALKHDDADLVGPIFFLLCLGFSLLLQGKVHFGVIYGFGVFGVVSLYGLLNLLAPTDVGKIHFWSVMSTLGYCLLPVVLVAVVGIVVSLTGWLGAILSSIAIGWCTFTATRFFESAFNMEKQRYLIAYPIGLLYSIFVLLAMF